jgi:hypothetical protein
MRVIAILLVLFPVSAFAQHAKRPRAEPPPPDPAVVALIGVVGNPEKPVPDRVQAALALGRRRDPGARTGLEPSLSDPQAAVRAAVARALGQIGDVAALPALRAVKSDAEPAVREAVDDAIDGLGGDPDAPVDWTAVRRVVRLGDLTVPEDAMPALPVPAGTATPGATAGPATAAPAPGTAAPATAAPGTAAPGSATPATADPGQVASASVLARAAAAAGARAGANIGAGLAPVAFQIAVRHEVRRLPALYLIGDGRPPAAVRREIARRHLETMRIEGSVSKVRYRTNARGTCVFAEVALLLAGDRDRNIRLTLSGSATAGALGHAGRPIDVGVLEERAIAEAVRAALGHLQTE